MTAAKAAAEARESTLATQLRTLKDSSHQLLTIVSTLSGVSMQDGERIARVMRLCRQSMTKKLMAIKAVAHAGAEKFDVQSTLNKLVEVDKEEEKILL